MASIGVLLLAVSGWRKSIEKAAISEFSGVYCEEFGGFKAFDEDGERLTDLEQLFEDDCRKFNW